MDKVLMFTAYIGLLFGSIGFTAFAGCCLGLYIDNFTDSGRFAISLLRIQGKRRIYPVKKWLLMMVLGLGWFLVWRYG